MTVKDIWSLSKDAAGKWNDHNAPRLSAALAYYALLSLAPVVVLLILICGLVFARSSAEQHLLDQVRNLAGNQWVGTLRILIENTEPNRTGVIASVVAIVVFSSERREYLWSCETLSTQFGRHPSFKTRLHNLCGVGLLLLYWYWHSDC